MIKRVADFLGKTYNEEEIKKLSEHLHINNFRNNPMVNKENVGLMEKGFSFIRDGKTGGWKDYFTNELEEEADQWIAQNLVGTSLKFPIVN